MFVRTQSLQAALALIERVLAGLVAAVPPRVLDINSTVHLYTTGPALSPQMVLADFIEATFTGSAFKTLSAVLGPINLPGGQGMHEELDWVCTVAPAPAQTILGIYIVDADTTTLLAAEQFAAPVAIAAIGDALSYDLVLAPKSRWGGEFQA
jgi:hypothetical protein